MKRTNQNAGFSLIELLVVIAIMAVLAGVGVAGYSIYTEEANKGADLDMVAKIERALNIAYQSGNFNEGEGGYVILSANGVKNAIAAGSSLDKVLKDTFGDDYTAKLKLKHNKWIGLTSDQIFAEAYKASSYNGNEDALITQIGSVTNTLKDALAGAPNLVGTSFENYLTNTGVNKNNNQAVANAVILYAAETIGDLDAVKTAAVESAFANFYDATKPDYFGNMGELTLALKNTLGTYGAVAAIYAHGEAFGQYVAANGNTELLEDFHTIDVSGVANTEDALTQVANNLDNLVQTAKNDLVINPYALQYIGNGQYAKDVTAYLESMKKIDANADKFSDKLGSDGCYTDGTAASLLQAAVAAGALDISCSDGEVAIWINNGITGNSVSGIQN